MQPAHIHMSGVTSGESLMSCEGRVGGAQGHLEPS